MSNLPLLTLITFLPLLGALVIAFLPGTGTTGSAGPRWERRC
jgi:hypothetical protein